MPLDDQTELFYHVDENDKVIGSVTRAVAHADKTIIHRSVQIVLANDQGQVLLQKRSIKKDKHPGKWTVSASGHVTFGDEYQETAKRELQEELGVSCLVTFHSKSLNKGRTESEFAAIFTGVYNQTPQHFDQDEVDAVAWCSTDQIAEMCENGKLTFTGEHSLRVLGFLQ